MAKTRTVVLVSNHAAVVGGGELSLLGLLEGLDRSRWAPQLVVPGDGEVAARARAMGGETHVVALPGWRRPSARNITSVLRLRRLASGAGAALLHANGSRAMLYAGLAGRLARIPVIWHVRVADRDRVLDRILFRLASRVIVTSTAVARRLAWAPGEKVRRIPNGVDVARFSPRPAAPGLRRALGVPDHAPVVVSVGRFVAYKGYEHLLDAAATIDGVHWLLVGDGELRAALEARARALDIAARVHFLGWRDDVPDLLALGDVVVMPSLGEHFGRVLIEAMAMARPVVATDAGGVPEIVVSGETGLLVPPGRADALADAVRSLLAAPERAAAFGRAGRLRAEREFSLARHVRNVEALYDELADGAPGAAAPGRGCNLCGSFEWTTLEAAAGTRVVHCACGLVFVTPQPSRPVLEAAYDEPYYRAWEPQARRRNDIWRRRAARVEALVGRGKLLDVGCGTGAFMVAAGARGFEVTGTELSPAATRLAAASGLTVHQGELWEVGLAADQFDAVTCWHVLEHQSDPRRLLDEIHRVLRPGGRLILATPNLEAHLFRAAYLMARRRRLRLWEPDEREVHLFHFSPRTLARLVEHTGLRVEEVTFDTGAAAERGKRLVDTVAHLWFRMTGMNWGIGIEVIASRPGTGVAPALRREPGSVR
jgi:glycosyltransferase involved in cell wall biosynthesis/2-polyprenyl-3-methyl-5-hydroxy-6-metoxy-1,4-benzoquinol methylase